MVNAWALAASILDGTLDEDYPIMKDKKSDVDFDEIKIKKDEFGYCYPEYPEKDDFKVENDDGSPYEQNYLADNDDQAAHHFDLDLRVQANSPYNDGWTAEHYQQQLYDWQFDELDEKYTEAFDHLMLNSEGKKSETMDNIREPSERKRDGRYKYHEAQIIQDIEDYVSSTYNGHYTGDTHEYRNVQTIDLMAARSLASSFCQSNILKYGSRYGSKDGRNKKDLLKVIHYAMLLLHFDEHYGKPSITSGNIDHNMP